MGIDPVSLAIVGTVVSAIGSVAGGIQGMQSANYNAKLASRNAEIAKRQGELEAERLDRDGRRQRGAIAAAYGANIIVGGDDHQHLELSSEQALRLADALAGVTSWGDAD